METEWTWYREQMVDRSSQSTAIVSLRSPWATGDEQPARRARWRLDAYGAQTAATQLDRQTKLRITAQGRANALRMSFAWGESYD